MGNVSLVGLSLAARLSIGIALAACLAYLTTPVAIRTARRFAFYDQPLDRKAHSSPTPYLGGAAVMVAFALALLVGAGAPGHSFALLAGVAMLWVVGTIDDRHFVSPQLRVVFELSAGALLWATGLGWHLGAGELIDVAATAVWVVAVVNAFNLFDNMDGAASSMALVVAAGACILGVLADNSWVAAGSAALCGACLGFLPYNLASPARVFLGDGGSMPLGFAVAALVCAAARSAAPSSLALVIGFLMVGIPALDTCLVVISRSRRGVSILTGGQDHLTHRTRGRMRTARRVALVLGSAQALVSALVIVAGRGSSTVLVYILLAFVVCATATIFALEDSPAEAPETGEAARSDGREDPSPTRGGAVGGHGAVVDRATLIILAALGLGAGIGPFFHAYYNSGVWIPIGLGLVLAAAMAAIARPPPLTYPTVVVLIAVAGLGLWSLLSAAWSPTEESAMVAANRWLVYAAALLLAIVLLRTARHAKALLLGILLGTAIVAMSVIVRMLGGDAVSLFVGGRLNLPLGYINGQACVFAVGCWLTLALAERREPWVAGLGAGGTVALACLTLLSQSRGAALATVAAMVVTVVALPGRRRRVLALALVVGAVVSAGSAIVDVYSKANAGALSASTVHSAAGAILEASLLAGVVWGLLVAITQAIDTRGGPAAIGLRNVATAAAVAAIALPALVGLTALSSVERNVRSQWHAFVHLGAEDASSAATSGSSRTRLLSGAGNRYDYWRAAWKVFTAHPVVGAGSGSFTAAYYRQRRTTEAIQNPHSIELELLSELGVVGAVLLAVLVGGTALGARRLWLISKRPGGARTMLVATTGVAVVWLAYSSVDWMHLLPGVTFVALGAIAILSRGGWSDASGPGVSVASEPRVGRRFELVGGLVAPGRLPKLLAATGAAFVLAVAGASLLRAALTQLYLNHARAELRRNPSAALSDAGRALTLDAANLDAYYIDAAALARFNRAADARATLLAAVQQDPTNFVTWVLLGDLEVRLRDFRVARVYYRRALALNPREPELRQLARNPSGASP